MGIRCGVDAGVAAGTLMLREEAESEGAGCVGNARGIGKIGAKTD